MVSRDRVNGLGSIEIWRCEHYETSFSDIDPGDRHESFEFAHHLLDDIEWGEDDECNEVEIAEIDIDDIIEEMDPEFETRHFR